ncbi:MAG TPA: hypothetical protein VHJ83_15045 [Micromonosporaceae bacterium]|nr:hypothetical protein [Micromonosporaceae bacterium]
MSTAIPASGLVKTFGRTVALDGLDLQVASGEVALMPNQELQGGTGLPGGPARCRGPDPGGRLTARS